MLNYKKCIKEKINQMRCLVTGGSGLVGRYLSDIMQDATYISSDDFDLRSAKETKDMMIAHKPEVVVHLAARVGGIIDNINYPVDYFEENTLINMNVLQACHKFKVDRVISILSTCIYPDKADTYPMREKDLFNGPPTPTNFSYAFSKRCMAAHIDAYVKQYNKKWCYLIPCNLYGKYDKYGDHNSHFVSALIKKIYYADNSIELWGTGKPLRQFMLGSDLAKVIKYMINNCIVDNFNVAPNFVYSIKEIAEIGKKVCEKENLEISFDYTKPDGQFRKDVDSSKLLSIFKDFEFTGLEKGIKEVYDNFSQRHN